MPKTYRECPACSKRALSIATRCPACGAELLTQPVRKHARKGGLPRVGLPLVAAGLLVGAGVIALVVSRRTTARDRDGADTASAPAEVAVLDTSTAAASPAGLPRPAASASTPGAGAVERYARTWTKVRARPSVKGELVAVLLPGDTVLADSTKGNWVRVALEGEVLGYVYAPTLLP